MVDQHLPNALAILRNEHRELADLFVAYDALKTEERRIELLRAICVMVRLHYLVETGVFVPEIARAVGKRRMSILAATECATVMGLINELEHPDPGGDLIDSQFRELGFMVGAHIATAEHLTGTFNLAAGLDLDWDELEMRLLWRRRELSRSFACSNSRR